MKARAEEVRALLKGAYDLHIHTGPDFRTRSVDDFEALRQADEYGMAGILIKNHYEPTQARAWTANQYAGTAAVAYGGIVLNHTVGGLNPFAAENSLRQGAKIVWLPTMDSALSVATGKGQEFAGRTGISVLNEKGELRREVYDIMDCVKAHNVYLATGHLATEQSLVVCREALACGVKIIFTHPDWKRDRVPVNIQSKLAQQGVLIEKVFRMLPPDEMCRSICEIGFEHCFVVTDRGQPGEAVPMDAMVDYVSTMVGYGMAASEIQMLIRDNPARILGK